MQQPAPNFKGTGVINDSFKEIQLSDKGKYVVLGFYPLDFTFVRPTELVALDDKYEKFKILNAEKGCLRKLKYPLLLDINNTISRNYDVLLEKGCSVDEALQLIEALQFVEKHEEECPANWTKVGKTIKPNPKGSKEYLEAVNKSTFIYL